MTKLYNVICFKDYYYVKNKYFQAIQIQITGEKSTRLHKQLALPHERIHQVTCVIFTLNPIGPV